jgi:hypothetical protein
MRLGILGSFRNYAFQRLFWPCTISGGGMRYFSGVLSGVMVRRWVMCAQTACDQRAACNQRALLSLSSVQKVIRGQG